MTAHIIDPFGLGVAGVAGVLVAVFVGTAVQRLAGQGFGMIAAPLLALLAPGAVPATLLLLGFLVGLSTTAIDLRAVEVRDLPAGMAGRALGAALAAAIAVAIADTGAFAPVVAGAIFLGIALSLVGARVPVTHGSLFVAGLTAGVMGTLTAVGAPPMALLYQHAGQRRAAAMQNAFFLWGMAVSIAALAAAGLVTLAHLAFALALTPAVAAGIVASHPLARRVAGAAIRPWALGLAGAAATLLLLAGG